MHNPLEQFIVHPIFKISVGGFNLSFTNSTLFMLIASLILMVAGALSVVRRKEHVNSKDGGQAAPSVSRLAVAMEMLYEVVVDVVKSTAGPLAKKYVPFVFTLYAFLLIANLTSMIPGTFTVTSHIIVTFSIAIFIFISVTLIGFVKHGVHYIALFVPEGTPILLMPLMFVIELFAYLARPVSLSLRLAANMTAGHIMLKVIASLIIISGWFGALPLALLTLLTGFEIFIAILQAYIFTVLSCVYLSDALNLH
ncbi:ATP synthase subunit a [Alphaproteobacteria bacterium]